MPETKGTETDDELMYLKAMRFYDRWQSRRGIIPDVNMTMIDEALNFLLVLAKSTDTDKDDSSDSEY